MWCTIRLVEDQAVRRTELVQSILAYVGMASFLTYRDDAGVVRYAIWFEDRHLAYVMGLHAANPSLGGVEIKPTQQPAVLESCRMAWDMEMVGYGADPLPSDTGTRSATAALGTQITDTSYRLLVCQRVPHSYVIDEYERSGGHPVSIYRKIAGMAAREAIEVLREFSQTSGPAPKPNVKGPNVKSSPYTHARIILGANTQTHLEILQDSFPAGSIRRKDVVRPGDVPVLATTSPQPKATNVHFPVFNDEDLGMLEILPTMVTEVPLDYGRAVTTTTQAPSPWPNLVVRTDATDLPRRKSMFLADEDLASGPETSPAAAESETGPDANEEAGQEVSQEPDGPESKCKFPICIIGGGRPAYPIRIIKA